MLIPLEATVWKIMMTYILFLTVNSIALVKPEKAKMLENMLIQMAQRGQLSGKVGSYNSFKLMFQFH